MWQCVRLECLQRVSDSAGTLLTFMRRGSSDNYGLKDEAARASMALVAGVGLNLMDLRVLRSG